MSNLKSIRLSLQMTQSALAAVFGQSKGNISHYESGKQDLPPHKARELIRYAGERGIILSFDEIYGAPPVGADTAPPQPLKEIAHHG